MVGLKTLITDISNPSENVATLLSLLGFTTVFFFVYWWFREHACIVVCPYGRLQGVLLDKNSIVVGYDYNRGEPRGKVKRESNFKLKEADHCKCTDCKSDGGCNEALKKMNAIQPVQTIQTGDCIDCMACVKVCPTGIDIRNGTQLECVNCTACMDACDAIMTKLHRPTGLIRYASENSISKGTSLSFTKRIKAYSAVLCLLLALLVFLLVSRTDLDARLMRTAGMTYTSLPDGRVSNLYNLKLANKTHKDIPVHLKLENIAGEIFLINSTYPVIKKEDYTTLQFFVKLNRKDLKSYKTTLIIGMYDSTEKIKTITAKFIGPEVYN
jgi:polyferredoxin